MQPSDGELLRRLGSGHSIASVCEATGWSRAEFDEWWQRQTRARVPSMSGTLSAGTTAPVEIRRDEHGIPHIFAENEPDLFFAYGFAMAQDRLFQLDWLRRKGSGRLAEVVGRSGLESDLVVRTVGLRRIAEAEWEQLPEETKSSLASFADGINTVIRDSAGRWPIEFDLLGYVPEPWSPIDSLVIEGEFRWYLTGRFPIIVMPELARRSLGDGPLWREFCLGEFDGEAILPRGSYPRNVRGAEPVGISLGGPDPGIGSNNWVVNGARSADGKPMVASDPHIAFEAVSCWYEARLSGGRYQVAGMTYVGMPAIMFGRNERVAWAITNNICSLRDLYEERTDPAHPGCFQYEGAWEPAREITEEIRVRRDEADVSAFDRISKTIRVSRNGPIVNEILPPPANRAGEPPISLKWLGMFKGGFLTALQQMNRARTAVELRDAMRPWHVPTFCLVFADVDGNIGMKASGRIPIRKMEERGYRPGWDPEHQWQGLIPFEAMPGVINPERGWMGTANNRLAANDYPYLLFGRWSNGARGLRLRQRIEDAPPFSRDGFRDLHQDCLSLRGLSCVPGLMSALRGTSDPLQRAAVEQLRVWNGETTPDSVATTVFNVFFSNWARRVASERFPADAVELLMKGAEGVAARLLHGDPEGWFAGSDRETAIQETFAGTVAMLAQRFGNDVRSWTWSRLHTMPLKHVLSGRGDLGKLLDHGGAPVRGDMVTVCNTGSGPDWTATSGAGYRLIAELGSQPPTLWAVDAQSQSGHPGSPHYRDQFEDWATGRYHALTLDKAAALSAVGGLLRLTPSAS